MSQRVVCDQHLQHVDRFQLLLARAAFITVGVFVAEVLLALRTIQLTNLKQVVWVDADGLKLNSEQVRLGVL